MKYSNNIEQMRQRHTFSLLPSSNSTPNSISTSTQLDLHFKSIQLLQELSWSYALYLVSTTTHHITFPNYKTK